MKKLIAIMLLLAMMLTVFVACSDKNDENSETTTAPTKDPDGTSGGEVTTDLRLPDRDFEGYVFRWLTVDIDPGIVVDEGEVVDESSKIYQSEVERDSEIMDRFNVKFADVKAGGTVPKYILTDSLNMESSYDGATLTGNDNVSDLIVNDVVYDVNKIPYLNLDQDWYQQQANEEYTILGKQYFVVGSFPEYCEIVPMFFNKNMLEDLNLEMPYDMITNGTWTIEEMMRYTSTGYKDTNAAVQGPDAGDTFGYASTTHSISYFYQGMGGPTTTRNDKGEVVPVFSDDKIDAIFTKVDMFFRDPAHWTKDNSATSSHMAFFEGRAMFCYWVTRQINYKEIDTFERGLAILPKFDTDQENYCNPTVGSYLFPANLYDADITGYIYEGLCEATERIVYPATIQEAIDFEELPDAGSIEVKKIVDKTAVFDILKNCDPSGGNLASCRFIFTCLQSNTTPAAMAPTVKPIYEQMFSDFFAKVQQK